MHYQIFLPNKRTADPAHLDAAGLAHLRDTAEFFETPQGPGDSAGLLCAWRPGRPAERVGFYPTEQTWQPAFADCEGQAAGRYWIGFWNQSSPTPGELAKPPGVDGVRIELGDGHAWQVPAAVRLPRRIEFAPAGGTQSIVQEDVRWLWEQSGRWLKEFLRTDEAGEPVVPERVDPAWPGYVLRALQLNYRLTVEVANHLRLFTEANVIECVGATLHSRAIFEIEREIREEAQKKTAAPRREPAPRDLAGIPAG